MSGFATPFDLKEWTWKGYIRPNYSFFCVFTALPRGMPSGNLHTVDSLRIYFQADVLYEMLYQIWKI